MPLHLGLVPHMVMVQESVPNVEARAKSSAKNVMVPDYVPIVPEKEL